MKAKVNIGDCAGYIDWRKAKVIFNGQQINHVIEADEESGYVIVFRRKNGDYLLNKEKTEVLKEKLYGHVEIKRVY